MKFYFKISFCLLTSFGLVANSIIFWPINSQANRGQALANSIVSANSTPLPLCSQAAAGTPCQNEPYGLAGADTKTPSQNAAALGGQGSNNSAGKTAQQVGQALMAAAQPLLSNPKTMPIGMMLMALAMLAMKQSGANKSTAANHGYNASQNTAGDAYNTRATNPATVAGFSAEDILSRNGIKYDPKTGTFKGPNGTSFSMGDLGSQKAMEKAGVPAADYAKAMKLIKDTEKKALEEDKKLKSIEMGYESGSGAATTVTTTSEPESSPRTFQREPTSVAGMVRNYNGESIGVAGDTLFEMMARRYRDKNSKSSFLPPEDAP